MRGPCMTRFRLCHVRPLAPALLAALCLGLVGCGSKTYPVNGKLVWPDGSPVTELTGGTVVFEPKARPKAGEPATGASGDIKEDGGFSLSTFQPDDGAPPGDYYVAVVQPL